MKVSKKVAGVEYAIRDIVSAAREIEKQGKTVDYLNIGDPVQFGFQPPENVKRALINAVNDGNNFYTQSEGLPELLNAIAKKENSKGLSISSEHVLVTNGVSEGLDMIISSIVEDGDDFIVNGTKVWTSGAHRADHIMVLTRTDPDAPKHRGISFLLCDMNTPGITVNPIINMAGDHSFNMVTFEDVRIPKRNLVGEQNRGWYVGATLLDFERSGVDYSAAAKRTLEELVDFAKSNYKNGVLLSNDSITRNRLSDLAIEVEVSKLISYNIAWMQGQGLVPNKEASMGKVLGTELQQHVSETGMHMLGMHGQLEPGSKHVPLQGKIEHMYLTDVSQTIQAGTSEIQRNIIATRGLGLPRG